MKPVVLIILLLCSLSAFAGKPEIGYGQKSYIKISSINLKDTLRLSLSYFPILPPEKVTINSLISPDSATILNPDVYFPVEAYMGIDTVEGFSLYLVPGDTLEISVDFARTPPPKQAVFFMGRQAVISQYINDRNAAYPFRHYKDIGRFRNSTMDLNTLRVKTDSLERIELAFLEEYHKENTLPDWYYKTERAAIIYGKAERMALVPKYRRTMLQREVEVPADYFSFWEELPLDNRDALFSMEYLWYITAYLYKHFLNREGARLDKRSYFKRMFERTPRLADSLLSPPVTSVYLSNEFLMALQLGFADLYDSLAAPGLARIRDKKIRKILSEFRRNKFLLKAGDTAFNFYLPDEEGAYYNLSDFRGRLVLLNFWFPGCSPCVFEMPYERALHKRFENRKFMLINVCLNRTRETVWKTALKRYNMSGLNLWANENWSGILGRNYDVISFPRYVLIGEDGKIIDPYAKKPSTGLMSEIEKLLAPSADE